jgi:GAF domain-containing protein
MNAGVAHFRSSYGSAFERYLSRPSEETLRGGYELGREAVTREVGVVDIAAVHHEVVLAALRGCSEPEQIERVTRAAGDFFLEAISAFEMVQRGYREAREATLLERRHAEMLRQLSGFLADASLTLTASDSLEEVLQLVAEQARELIGADGCIATAVADGESPVIAAASFRELKADPRILLRSSEFLEPPTGESDTDGPSRSVLAAPLRTLDGRDFGSIQVVEKTDGDFTEVDQAVLVHLAQMASAAIDRARLYRRHRSE